MHVQDLYKFFRYSYQRHKDHRFPAFAAFLHVACYAVKVRLQSASRFSGSKISLMQTYFGNVQLERNHFGSDRTEITVRYCLVYVVFIGQRLVIVSEVFHVPSVRRSGDS